MRSGERKMGLCRVRDGGDVFEVGKYGKGLLALSMGIGEISFPGRGEGKVELLCLVRGLYVCVRNGKCDVG